MRERKLAAVAKDHFEGPKEGEKDEMLQRQREKKVMKQIWLVLLLLKVSRRVRTNL